MKIYSREELEKLTTENPNELALVFARKVAGFPDACIGRLAEGSAIYPDREASISGILPNYLTDWTAVINAGKKAGIFWWKHLDTNISSFGEFYAGPAPYYSIGVKRCFQRSNWPDCAALIIVMIEVMQK